MITERSTRLLALAILCGILLVLLMVAGTLTAVPELHVYPTENDLGQDYATHQGERVEVKGTVVQTDPIVIEADYDTDRPFTLSILNVEDSVEAGQELRVVGTVHPHRTISAHETVVVSP